MCLFDIMIICFSRLHFSSLALFFTSVSAKHEVYEKTFISFFFEYSTKCLMNDAAVSRAFSKKSFIPLFRAKLTLTAKLFFSYFN